MSAAAAGRRVRLQTESQTEIEHAALFQLSLAGRMFPLSAVDAVQPSLLRGCVHLGTVVALMGAVSGGGGGGKHRTTR